MKIRDMYSLKHDDDMTMCTETNKKQATYPSSCGNRPCGPLNMLPMSGSLFSSAVLASCSSLENCIYDEYKVQNKVTGRLT